MGKGFLIMLLVQVGILFSDNIDVDKLFNNSVNEMSKYDLIVKIDCNVKKTNIYDIGNITLNEIKVLKLEIIDSKKSIVIDINDSDFGVFQKGTKSDKQNWEKGITKYSLDQYFTIRPAKLGVFDISLKNNVLDKDIIIRINVIKKSNEKSYIEQIGFENNIKIGTSINELKRLYGEPNYKSVIFKDGTVLFIYKFRNYLAEYQVLIRGNIISDYKIVSYENR